MARKRSHTRRSPRSNPRGVLTVHGGGFGFVQTAEGAYFIPASKMAGAFDGDLVEVAPLPPPRGNGVARHPHHGAARPGRHPAPRVVPSFRYPPRLCTAKAVVAAAAIS